METLFDLNIRAEFLEAWLVRHAVRELIANAFDEHALLDIDALPEIERGEDGWVLRDQGRGIRPQHLTQGESQEKLKSLRVIGKFGVGLKDALATLHRHGVEATIRTADLSITVEERAKRGLDGVQTLHAVLRRGPTGVTKGTEVHLKGVSDAEVEAAKQEFLAFRDFTVLATSPWGEVLARPALGRAPVFVRGVRVAWEDRFLFSYNVRRLTPAMKKALNRERSHLPRAAYEDAVRAMLVESREPEVTALLAREVRRLEGSGGAEELGWHEVAVRGCECLASQPQKVVFGSSRQFQRNPDVVDEARREGFGTLTVKAKVAKALETATDDLGRWVMTLSRFQKERAMYQFEFVDPSELTDAEAEVFARAEEVAGLLGLTLARRVEVRISETIRSEDSKEFRPVGLWQPGLRRIVIKRCQLGGFEDFAGTLLHELVHAVTGRGDVDREFEGGLTRALGEVAAQACGNPVVERSLAWVERRTSTVAAPTGGTQEKLFG